MMNYAQVIVDIPVAQLDQVYDYAIPERLRMKIGIGSAVLVPFGRRKINGFVVGLSVSSQIDHSKVKEIRQLITEEKLFDEKMLKLFKWVASYYKSYLIKVIKIAIPTGVITGQIKEKKRRFIQLNQSPAQSRQLIKKLKDKAPKQALVLWTLMEKGDKISNVSSLAKIANTYPGTVYRLIDKGYLRYVQRIEERRPYLEKDQSFINPFEPTPAQKKAIKTISAKVKENIFTPFLLHGVTGSGKTEVYLQVIEDVLNEGKGAIVLVPEISLTPIMVRRFYSRFGEKIAILHSKLSLGERYDEWKRLKRGYAQIAIGARSAIFAPIEKLGLIIIDEEHENSYKQGNAPYYHVRELALKRGRLMNAPVVLGSATPSLESYYQAKKGRYYYLCLPKRINQRKLPPVEVIDMREELKKGNITIFSSSLQSAIRNALNKGEQILIFLNRRGYANFILCRECGHVIKCKNCDISLTYHAVKARLCCHYCNYTLPVPQVCPECGSRYIREFGIGTEKIEEELKKFFPDAVVNRMDVDTTSRKGSYQRILKKFERGEIDILVGTQMIAKGHDYPNISVVGVITADTILNLPDFRSAERTFQLLTQVAGRTGRGDKEGKAIIQTYTPEHYSIQAAKNHDYYSFFNQEISLRKKLFYPPFSYLVNIIIKGIEERLVINEAQQLGQFLKQYQKNVQEILGPSPASINKIRNHFRWQIILKFKDWKSRDFILTKIQKNFLPNHKRGVNFSIDVDPLKML